MYIQSAFQHVSYNRGDWQAAASVVLAFSAISVQELMLVIVMGNLDVYVSEVTYNSKGNEWQYGFGATYKPKQQQLYLGFTHYGW